MEAWNPSLGGWPEGSCAYGGRGCAEGAGESPEVATEYVSGSGSVERPGWTENMVRAIHDVKTFKTNI